MMMKVVKNLIKRRRNGGRDGSVEKMWWK